MSAIHTITVTQLTVGVWRGSSAVAEDIIPVCVGAAMAVARSSRYSSEAHGQILLGPTSDFSVAILTASLGTIACMDAFAHKIKEAAEWPHRQQQ